MHELGSYKGSPTITLKKDPADKYGFTFGKAKAQLIAANLAAVLEFAGEETPQIDPMGVDRQYEDDCQRRTGA